MQRWLFHVRPAREGGREGGADRYAPASLAREGFIHASYRDAVLESARLYFAAERPLEVLQIDPRRLDVKVEVATTPRGPMPHIHGSIPTNAIHAIVALEQFAPAGYPDDLEP